MCSATPIVAATRCGAITTWNARFTVAWRVEWPAHTRAGRTDGILSPTVRLRLACLSAPRDRCARRASRDRRLA